ncbi:uncharacterized protein LOC132204492 [Neocloeon triangulifer]|uniref:uncharacterized protein LOC132204492 n=1 Tax=Neocloeon triangulifer TaxID=2078957 RepID=UPI00286FAEC5|nr:uncharacterized protein LOC132204492 [Neocloeon triangulifer]
MSRRDQVLLVALLVFVRISASVQTGEDKKEARDGLFMDVDPPLPSGAGFTFGSFADDLMQCNPRSNNIFTNSDGLGECLKRRAVTHLLSGAPSTVGFSDAISFVASADTASGSRALPHFQHYPGEAPSLAEAMRHFLGQRIMRWQLDTLYPGLVMRVGPMGVHDSGMLEFVLEKLYDDTDRALGPGKLLVKRTVLPALLGFKLKLSTLMPILLAVFFFMASKAVFFSKVAIMFGALIGLKSFLFSGHHSHHGHLGPYGLHPVGHASEPTFWDSFFDNGLKQQHNPYGPVSFKSVRAIPQPQHQAPAPIFQQPEILDPANDHVPRDLDGAGQQQRTVKFADVKPLVVHDDQRTTAKRNFAWDETELKKMQQRQ